jgi:hypothetical protein
MSQLEICLNDVRTDPLKYKVSYTCNYDTDIAPRLMTGGRLLPLNRADAATTKAADRFPLIDELPPEAPFLSAECLVTMEVLTGIIKCGMEDKDSLPVTTPRDHCQFSVRVFGLKHLESVHHYFTYPRNCLEVCCYYLGIFYLRQTRCAKFKGVGPIVNRSYRQISNQNRFPRVSI